MKFEQHRVLAKSTTQTHRDPSSFNYRGPNQTIKSLQATTPQTSNQGMLDLLTTDLCLKEFFQPR